MPEFFREFLHRAPKDGLPRKAIRLPEVAVTGMSFKEMFDTLETLQTTQTTRKRKFYFDLTIGSLLKVDKGNPRTLKLAALDASTMGCRTDHSGYANMGEIWSNAKEFGNPITPEAMVRLAAHAVAGDVKDGGPYLMYTPDSFADGNRVLMLGYDLPRGQWRLEYKLYDPLYGLWKRTKLVVSPLPSH